MQRFVRKLCAAIGAVSIGAGTALASSHMDAPLITLDPSANTTDVYAFVDEDNGDKKLVVALGVYPFEEPGIGPNEYSFDENVRYTIHVALGDDVALGRATVSYRFDFETEFLNENTILQAFQGEIQDIHDDAQNLRQTYRVTRFDRRDGSTVSLGKGRVPPNNQGNATPFYNQDNNGENPARNGVATDADLDRYTQQAIAKLDRGHVAFAGQRDDGFFADIQAIFDLLTLRQPGKDSQGGFNIHLIALEIPIEELGGDQQVAGVYATTSRRRISILTSKPTKFDDIQLGGFVQVARQGNPLFNEALVAIADKDLYSRTSPSRDHELFNRYAENPELCRLINALIIGPNPQLGLDRCVEIGRDDIAGIYIPDLIKVDLSTRGARLAGGGPDDPFNPDDPGFSRLSFIGGDFLQSAIQDPFGNGGLVAGGWPNGRRFGDDVVDIAITALLGGQGPVGDGVDANDMAFSKVFPYEATPQNGRVHGHHGRGAIH